MKSLGCLLIFASSFVLAQEKHAPAYRLHFRISEGRAAAAEAKSAPAALRPVQEQQTHILVVQAGARGRINASRRIPYYIAGKDGAKELHTAALGSIIDCRPEDRGSAVRLDFSFESSHVSRENQPASGTPPPGGPPVANSRQAHSVAIVPLGPEVQLAQLDDPTTGNRVQLFVAAEKLE